MFSLSFRFMVWVLVILLYGWKSFVLELIENFNIKFDIIREMELEMLIWCYGILNIFLEVFFYRFGGLLFWNWNWLIEEGD